MNSGPLLDNQVTAMTKDFLCVRVDSDERPDLVTRWDVRELPGLFFFSPDGGMLARRTAPLALGNDVVALMGKALRALAKIRALEGAAAKRPDDARAARSLADGYLALQSWEAAAGALAKALDLDPGNAAGSHEPLRNLLVYAQVRQDRFADAADAAETFERLFPASAELPKVLSWRAVCLQRLERTAEAVAVWERIATTWPDHPAAAGARESIQRAREAKPK